MGRTNPTFRDVLARLEDDWQPYRRGLRRADQPVFDRLFEHARRHADACGLQNHPDPLVPVLLSVTLEQAKRTDALEARIADLDGTDEESEGVTPESGTEREP